jgi:hypothetical protein
MKTNETGSSEPNRNNSGNSANLSGHNPDPTKKENPQKNDPTRREPGQPDHTEPKPKRNDPTRINPDWNDPSKVDPTESSAQREGKGSQAPEQKESDNSNYTGEYKAKDKSGSKNYTGSSAGFMAEGSSNEEEETDNNNE